MLAAHPTRLGVQFVTWDWSFDRTGLNQGNYFQENYAGAKQDFAIRAGLISKQQIFNPGQLIEIYRCCSDTLDAGFDLTAEQEKCIQGHSGADCHCSSRCSGSHKGAGAAPHGTL